MENFFTYFKIRKDKNLLEWRTFNQKKELEKEEMIIKENLKMDMDEFKKKFKYIRSDMYRYIDFKRERPINIDLLSDFRNGLAKCYLSEIDLEKIVDSYEELIKVVKMLKVIE